MAKKLGKLFMAFGKTNKSTEGGSVQRIIGVGSARVLALNPTKAELEKILGRNLDNEPEYLKDVEVEEGKIVKQAIIRIWVQLDPETAGNNGRDDIIPISYTLRNMPHVSSKGTIKVINNYGETTWIPVENAKVGTLPESQNWFNGKGLRPATWGEEELLQFFRQYLVIAKRTRWNADLGRSEEIPNVQDAEGYFENINKVFSGDWSELRKLIALEPTNKVKIPFGVRQGDDNRFYQVAFTRMILKNATTNYTYLEEEIKKSQEAGAYKDVTFRVGDIQVFEPATSTFSQPTQTASPNSTNTGGWFD